MHRARLRTDGRDGAPNPPVVSVSPLFSDKVELVVVGIRESRISDLRQLELLDNNCAQRHWAFGVAVEVGRLQIEMHTVALRGEADRLLKRSGGIAGEGANWTIRP